MKIRPILKLNRCYKYKFDTLRYALSTFDILNTCESRQEMTRTREHMTSLSRSCLYIDIKNISL